MCDKAVNTHPSTMRFVPECYNTEEMCDKAVDRCPFVIDSVPDQYKTQEICDKIVSEDPFKLKYYHDRYKTKCVINPLMIFYQHLILFLIGLLQVKLLKKDSGDVIFSCNEVNILSTYLSNFNLD